MKIAVSAEGTELKSRVGGRFGTASHFIIIDTQTMAFEAVLNPGATAMRAAGIQAVVLAISREVDAVLTGFCSPTAMKHLSDNGIEVLTGVNGTVAEAVAQYQKLHPIPLQGTEKVKIRQTEIDRAAVISALKSSGKQLVNLFPIFFGVILLVGLFKTLISKELLLSIFSGGPISEALGGTGFGSIIAGNPINSYVIGNELLEYGVSLFAVTAFMVSWVTVGLVQLPAEIAALGKKFAIIRNAAAVVLCMAISILTVITYTVAAR